MTTIGTDMREAKDERLETPRSVGYRAGMSEASVIGSRLARMFDVAPDMPRDMGTMLRVLDRKTRDR